MLSLVMEQDQKQEKQHVFKKKGIMNMCFRFKQGLFRKRGHKAIPFRVYTMNTLVFLSFTQVLQHLIFRYLNYMKYGKLSQKGFFNESLIFFECICLSSL